LLGWLNTTPTNSVYGAMQDGYVERFDQKISPCPSLPVYDRKRITKEGDNNFPLWQRGNKGDFVNCRSSINITERMLSVKLNVV
jgi:hypothetical protein